MPRIVVVGAGTCGLAAAMMLARDGHDVTVLERDPDPVPDSPDAAWDRWARAGVAQFRQPHFLQARARHVLDAELPDVRDALAAAGALRVDPLDRMPPTIADRARRPGDERFVTLTARRPTVEHVFARAAEAEPRVDVRRGSAVLGLVTRALARGVHVSGVRTDAGEELDAELVVDAMGRRSPLPRWLRDAGAPPVLEEAEDSGFVYYSRYFRGPDGRLPEVRAPLVSAMGSFSLITLPADRGTWSVTVFTSSGDQPLKRLRHVRHWTSLVSACPRHAHWLDGEPTTGVLAMAGVIDRRRRLAVDGGPVVTGVAPVADAWACTNPSLGRGVALGLAHVAHLREVARTHLDDPRRFAEAWDEVTERELTPWYRENVQVDRARLAEVEALRLGREPARPSDPEAVVRASLTIALAHDPDAFRAAMESFNCITPLDEVLARPGLARRLAELARDRDAAAPPGPTREELLRLLE